MMTETKGLRTLEELARLVYGKNDDADREAPTITPHVERCKTPQEVLEFAATRKLVIVDFKFTDLFGRWHHFSSPIHYLVEEHFEEGIGFDGSSIRAFQDIHESDMLLVPDPTTAVVDPVLEAPTLSLICNIYDPETGKLYRKDARWVAQKAERFLIESGIADVSYWGPEAEFFVFDGVSFEYQPSRAHFQIDSDMGSWENRRGHDGRWGPNLGYRPRTKRGYYRVPPIDQLQDWRTQAILRLMAVGIDVEVHHGEVASAGQQEIDLKFAPLLQAADQLQWYKYILKNVAVAYGKTVTFMPKPMFEDNGSGMHCHQSLWKGESNVFYDKDGYGGLSQEALWYVGGIIHHTPALLALVAPTTNSYKRLVPGYEAPVILAYSKQNRSACVRIPVYSDSEASKRIEYRPPDAAGNPYLSFAAMLMAGIDGILNKIDPGEPMDLDLYETEVTVHQVPGSLEAVLARLEDDHEFLLRGDVFDADVIEAWIDWKRKNDVDAIRTRPHPYEFELYYDT